MLKDDINIGVRCAAVNALSVISTSPDVKINPATLLHILKFERDDDVVLATIDTSSVILQQLDPDDSRHTQFKECLYGRTKSSDSMSVRLAASTALGLKGLPEDQEAAEQRKTIQAALSKMCTYEFTLKQITNQSKQKYRQNFFNSL